MTEDPEGLRSAIQENKERLQEIQKRVQKIHSYLFWAFVAIVISVVLPLIGMIFVIPMFLNRYAGLV